MERYYFLTDDFNVLNQTIEDLQEKIKALGKEQGEVASQSTENFGHDDACQEIVDHERRIAVVRLNELRKIAAKANVVKPADSYDTIRIGATVKLSNGKIFRIGSYMVFTKNSIVNISYNSPLGKALLNKHEGDDINFRGENITIMQIIK